MDANILKLFQKVNELNSETHRQNHFHTPS